MHNQLLSVGTNAPQFSLKDTPDQRVSLSDFQGKPVVLLFYPADFSPVCGSEVDIFNAILPEFNKYNTQLLGISVDNIWSHLAFVKAHNLHFPLLSDFQPKGNIAKMYNTYNETLGEADRSLYLIDEKGVIVWNYLSPIGVNPGADGVLQALEDVKKH